MARSGLRFPATSLPQLMLQRNKDAPDGPYF